MTTYQTLSRAVGLLTLLCLAFPALAQTTVDFEGFAEGEIVSSVSADGITIDVFGLNPQCPTTNAAAIFDSDCDTVANPGNCTGGNPAANDDNDLGVDLGNILIVHERCNDLDNGFVNDPGDNPAGPDDYGNEGGGGINGLDLDFSEPVTLFCFDVIDKEGTETDELTLVTTSGSTDYTLPKPGNKAVETFCPSGDPNVGVEEVLSLEIRQTSSGAYDNFVFDTPPDDCEDQCFDTNLTYSDINEGEGEYTYTFETCKVSDFCRGFSFVAIEIPDGAEVLSASRSYSTNSNGSFDPDDYDFIKFEDIGGSGDVGQCESITFTLDTPYESIDDLNVRIKFGRTQDSNQVKTEDIEVGDVACTDGEARNSAPFFDLARSATPSEAAVTAYPNPMNSRTTFSLTLEEAAEVRLVIYDVLGREVGVVTEGSFLPGTMTVSYDASDLPNGTYFYRLDASGKVTTGQLQVVR